MRTAFVFPGLNGAGHVDEQLPLLALPGFVANWRLVTNAFGEQPGFATFDAALQSGGELPQTTAAWPWRALAVTAMQLAAAQALEQRGERADWLCGYSIGDLARSCHAGAASFPAIVAFAATLPDLPRAPGATAAVIANSAAVADAVATALASHDLAASRLSKHFLMLAGSAAAIDAALRTCQDFAVRTQRLASCPLHAPLQQRLATVLLAAAGTVRLATPRRPMFSTLWGRATAAGDDLRAEFAANIRAPIDFAAAIAQLHEQHGVTRFIDLGPGRHATRFVRHHSKAVEAIPASSLLGNDCRRSPRTRCA